MHEIRITSKQTFQETENCRKMDLLALKTLTVPQTNDFGFSVSWNVCLLVILISCMILYHNHKNSFAIIPGTSYQVPCTKVWCCTYLPGIRYSTLAVGFTSHSVPGTRVPDTRYQVPGTSTVLLLLFCWLACWKASKNYCLYSRIFASVVSIMDFYRDCFELLHQKHCIFKNVYSSKKLWL